MGRARVIAIVGAESTGKTTLARELAGQLRERTGQRVAWVAEALREWCEATGRTPHAHEQAPLVRLQHERIEAAAATHDIVVADTTALMTAVYSRYVFDDSTLDARAADLHRRSVQLTLLTALDLPWQADGHQRDGAHVREPVDAMLRALMAREAIPYAVISGQGPLRLQQACAAAEPFLQQPTPERRGLFTGLAEPAASGTRWACECCQPAYEAALKRLRG
jgi:nicotinamide riboside kinase